MNMRLTELGQPIEVFTVIIKIAHYGYLVVPCSTEERAEWVVDQAYNKYVNVLDVDIQRSWLDDWSDDIEWLH